MLLALRGEKLDGLNCKQMFALTISSEVCFQWSCQQLFTVWWWSSSSCIKTDLIDWFLCKKLWALFNSVPEFFCEFLVFFFGKWLPNGWIIWVAGLSLFGTLWERVRLFERHQFNFVCHFLSFFFKYILSVHFICNLQSWPLLLNKYYTQISQVVNHHVHDGT